MKPDQNTNVLRLRKYHEPDPEAPPDIQVGQRLEAAQSLPAAFVAGLVAIVLFGVLWTMFSLLVDRFFPWFTLLMGALLGLAVRRAGLGLDWRFPVLAASMTLVGSLVGNVVVAAAFTASELDSSMFVVLAGFAQLDWAAFFDEVVRQSKTFYGNGDPGAVPGA